MKPFNIFQYFNTHVYSTLSKIGMASVYVQSTSYCNKNGSFQPRWLGDNSLVVLNLSYPKVGQFDNTRYRILEDLDFYYMLHRWDVDIIILLIPIIRDSGLHCRGEDILLNVHCIVQYSIANRVGWRGTSEASTHVTLLIFRQLFIRSTVRCTIFSLDED